MFSEINTFLSEYVKMFYINGECVGKWKIYIKENENDKNMQKRRQEQTYYFLYLGRKCI